MSRGRLFVGIAKDALVVRVGPEAYVSSLKRPHVHAIDLTGRPMRGYGYVGPPGFEADVDLARWVEYPAAIPCGKALRQRPAAKPCGKALRQRPAATPD